MNKIGLALLLALQISCAPKSAGTGSIYDPSHPSNIYTSYENMVQNIKVIKTKYGTCLTEEPPNPNIIYEECRRPSRSGRSRVGSNGASISLSGLVSNIAQSAYNNCLKRNADKKKVYGIYEDTVELQCMSPQEVQVTQSALSELGYYTGPISGNIDDSTFLAMNQFHYEVIRDTTKSIDPTRKFAKVVSSAAKQKRDRLAREKLDQEYERQRILAESLRPKETKENNNNNTRYYSSERSCINDRGYVNMGC